MTEHIYKYVLNNAFTSAVIRVPEGARILTAQMQGSDFVLWAAVDISVPLFEYRTFRVIPTGAELPKGLAYISTVQQGSYVWHIFEKIA